MAKVHIQSAGGGGSVATGVLQLQNGTAMDATLRIVTDQNNTTSPLKLSTGLVSVSSTLQIATSDTQYLDAEDLGGNNRFTISRNAGSQVVNVDFASNPTLGTEQVGAIRTYQNGVSLSDSISFIKNGNLQIGGASGLYWDNTNKRFGVGTNAPTSKLQIVTDDATNPQAFSNQTSILAGTASQGALISAFSSTNGAFLNALWPGNAWFKMNYGGTNHSFSVGGTVTAVIDSNTTFGNAATTLGARLGIKGSGSTSATTSLLVQNSSGTEMFRVQDDNKVSSSANIIDLRAQSYSLLGQSSSTIYCSTTYTALYSNPIILGAIATPNASSIVEISSTTKGFLPPRMTTTQKNAISSPAAGLQVYDSTTNRAAVYTSAWENVITETNGSPNSVYKLWSGSAAQYAALTPDSSTLYFVI